MATLNADHLNFGPLTFDSENDFKKEDRCFYKNAKQIHPIELFKFALKYFKEKKDFIAKSLTYKDQTRLSGYIHQISKWNFDADLQSPDLILLNVVEEDKNAFWESLKDMPKEEAMVAFTDLLFTHCPSFIDYFNAHFSPAKFSSLSEDTFHQIGVNNHSETNEESPSSLCCDDGADADDEGEMRRAQVVKRLQRRQRHAVFRRDMKELLDRQTLAHFTQYAKEQHPEDSREQALMVEDLQRQHFEHYYENVYLQQVMHQRQQYYQLQILAQQNATSTPRASSNHTFSHDNEPVCHGGDHNTHSIEITMKDDNNNYNNSNNYNNNTNDKGQAPLIDENGIGGDADKALVSKLNARDDVKIINETDTHNDPANEEREESPTDEENEEDRDSEFEEISERMPGLIPVCMWTQPHVEAFKQEHRDSSEHMIRVSSLSTATIKVPTSESGHMLCWQFATDYFDLGFGVFFEWNVSPPSEVMVQVNDSSDDEEEEGEERGDVERGEGEERLGPPMDELVQVVRRDSHLEVQCGKHVFPGRGVYHFKFDNSFSLWRSKTIYYNIAYS